MKKIEPKEKAVEKEAPACKKQKRKMEKKGKNPAKKKAKRAKKAKADKKDRLDSKFEIKQVTSPPLWIEVSIHFF